MDISINKINIKLVDLEKTNDGFYEYDFHPNRKFDDTVYIDFHTQECWGNVEYINFFLEHDRKNIKVICLTSRNLFPICNYICHKCILVSAEFNFFDDGKYKSMNNACHKIADFKMKYKIKDDAFYNRKHIYHMKKTMTIDEINEYVMSVINTRILYLEKVAYDKFMICKHILYKKNSIYVQNKNRPQYVKSFNDILKILTDNNIATTNIYYKNMTHNKILKLSGFDHFHSFQILSSIYYNCAYIGFAGSASLLCMSFFINSICVSDKGSNVLEDCWALKSKINYFFYNCATNGFIHYMDDESILHENYEYNIIINAIKKFNNIPTTNEIYKVVLDKSLDNIGILHGTDKSSRRHNYLNVYDSLFTNLRKEKISILELGVSKGQSLKMWEDYFINSESIIGVDINPKCKIYNSDRTNIIIENSTNKEILKKLNYKKFDIIIDDASHGWVDQIKSYEILYPLVKNGGYYIIEDLEVLSEKLYKSRYKQNQTNNIILHITNEMNSIKRNNGPGSHKSIEYFKFYPGLMIIKKL